MENFKFPDWVNTLVNGAIAGSLLLGVVEMGALRERVSVMETKVLGMIELVESNQRTTDTVQDGKIAALEKRFEDVEAKLRGPLARSEAASMAVPTWATESGLLSEQMSVTF